MNERITLGENWPLANCRLTTVREKTTPTVVIGDRQEHAAGHHERRQEEQTLAEPVTQSSESQTPGETAVARHYFRLFSVSLSLALRSASTSSSFVMSDRPAISSFWACS